ncbi:MULTISPECIES: glyoxalase [unclassified Flavobacterium]|uniref:glyoxalase n=1 Tax=unclassified Flavobacterium TaxID=196869 RepID=UPI0009618B42|nr:MULTISPECIES: glyoxalase [unclassified Flavobacterium]MBN9284510.1 glyoxalase [Flavobacterium sp.]OJV72805.1 MAG: glyoxalase [Flavobacterium sp. 40-81]
MENRDTFLIDLRGEALGTITEQSSSEEIFQNKILRPILRLQNELFIQVFLNYAVKQKNVFFSLTPDKKLAYIENVIQRDIKFRNSLKGMILGLFTVEEYQVYIKNSSNLNKRMMNVLIERLKSQVQLLELD